jgi:hypothetical protein
MSKNPETQGQITVVIDNLSKNSSEKSLNIGRGGNSSNKFVFKAGDTLLGLWNEIVGM